MFGKNIGKGFESIDHLGANPMRIIGKTGRLSGVPFKISQQGHGIRTILTEKRKLGQRTHPGVVSTETLEVVNQLKMQVGCISSIHL